MKECKIFGEIEDMAMNYPLEKCEGISGFLVEDWAGEINPKLGKLTSIKEDYCE